MTASKGFSRRDRISEQIRRELAELIRTELKDPRVGMISITGVEVSADYAHAKVFFSSMSGREHLDSVLAGLQKEMEGGRTLPILFKHYLQLGGRIAAFHEDRTFGTLDALLVVDLLNAPDKQLRRYVGEDGMRKLRNGSASL